MSDAEQMSRKELLQPNRLEKNYMHLSIMHTGRNACISLPQLQLLY